MKGETSPLIPPYANINDADAYVYKDGADYVGECKDGADYVCKDGADAYDYKDGAFVDAERAQRSNKTESVRVVGPIRLASILFFLAYGGSYGVEGSISFAPPFYVLIAFLLAPFLSAIPEAMITAELSSSIPCSGGNIVWAKNAFGDFLAWQSGFWALVNIPGAVAIYPSMLVGALENVSGIHLSFFHSALIHLAMVIFIVFVNIKGTKTVTGGNIIFSLLVLGPFAVLIGYGLATKGVVSWQVMRSTDWEGPILWRQLVTAAVWSCGGWSHGGQMAAEIYNPRRTFNISTIMVIILILCFSLLPLSIAIGVNPSVEAWQSFQVGAWVHVAQLLGGEWFRVFMGIGAIIGSLGEMNSQFCAQARMLHYLSSSDYMFPSWFSPMSKYNTPYVCVLTLGVISFIVSLLPFEFIMDTVVLIGSLSLLISYACLIKLRISKPDLSRPFEIPFGIIGLLYVTIMGIGISLIAISLSNFYAQMGAIVMAIIGVVLYYSATYMKQKGYVK